MRNVEDCDMWVVQKIKKTGRGKFKIENGDQSCLESAKKSMSKSTRFVNYCHCIFGNASNGIERDRIIQDCKTSTLILGIEFQEVWVMFFVALMESFGESNWFMQSDQSIYMEVICVIL